MKKKKEIPEETTQGQKGFDEAEYYLDEKAELGGEDRNEEEEVVDEDAKDRDDLDQD